MFVFFSQVLAEPSLEARERVCCILDAIKVGDPKTQEQTFLNLCSGLLGDSSKFISVANDLTEIASMDPANPVRFLTKFQQLAGQPEHMDQIRQLVLDVMPNAFDANIQLFYRHLMIALHKATTVPDADATPSICATPATVPESAYGKIRYVGGRCVAKTRYRHVSVIRGALDSGRLDDAHLARQEQVQVLEALTTTQSALFEGSVYQASLHETARCQNLTCGLTSLSDQALEFFLAVERKRLPLYQACSKGPDMLKSVEQSLLLDQDLQEMFQAAVSAGSAHTFTPSQLKEAFTEVTKSYMTVTDAEFRQRMLSELGKKTTMEHQKRVAWAAGHVKEKRAAVPPATETSALTSASTSASDPGHSCSVCGKVCKSKGGLARHMHIHKNL
jgi:hypothetical protein